MLERLGVLAAGIIGLTLCAAPASAEWVTVFRDDFDGTTLNAAAWEVVDLSGTFEVEGGRLHLRSVPNGLPTIASIAGVVPTLGPFRVRIGFQYGATTCYGTRLGLQSPEPATQSCPDDPAFYGFHRDCAVGTNVHAHAIGTYQGCDPGCGFCRVIFEPGAPAYHVGELTWLDEKVHAGVDGVELDVVAGSQPRPTRVFFGWGTTAGAFTEFDIEFVEVQVPEQPVPAVTPTWGKVKDHYRK
jgi:hypothetical protein